MLFMVNPEAFSVKLPTIPFFNGLVSAGVSAMLAHKDFNIKFASIIMVRDTENAGESCSGHFLDQTQVFR